MASKKSSILLTAATIGTLIGNVQAGAGANVQACYYTLDKPFRPFTVFFRAGDSADRCLNNVGQNARMTVSQAGVSCTSVGYVEGKDGDSGFDNCVVNPSIWTLSYKTDTTRESGNTTTRWVSHWLSDNEMTLETYSRGTVVCDSSTLCKSNYFHWDHDLGPAYIIFNPSGISPDDISSSDGQIVFLEGENVEL